MKCIVLRICIVACIFTVMSIDIYAQTSEELKLYVEDVRISEQPDAGGFFIYVKKKVGIASVLLIVTESAENPNRNVYTYALRTTTFNSINGNEPRVLNGRFIKLRNNDKHFIIDSSYEPDIEGDFGQMFVLFLPYKAIFGYESTRTGIFDLRQSGMYFSIRTFSELYANNDGEYFDNSFYLERIQNQDTQASQDGFPPNLGIPPRLVPHSPDAVVGDTPKTPAIAANPVVPTPTEEVEDIQVAEENNNQEPMSINDFTGLFNMFSEERYSLDAIRSFNNIADNINKVSAKNNSKAYKVENKNDIIDKIATILENSPKDFSNDIVIIIDTTRSMWDDLSVIKSRLVPTISEIMRGGVFRIGLVVYRDEGEEYITKRIQFNDQLDVLQRDINSLKAGGGGDWPEAVYEALDVAVNNFVWIAKNRTIFIIGDSPPHEPPNTDVNINQLYKLTAAKEINVYPLIVPKRDY